MAAAIVAAAVVAGLVLPAVARPHSAACPTLTLSPASGALPAGEVGKAYGPVSITVSGGSGKYSWSHDYYNGTAGLPPGLATTPALGSGGYGGATRTLSGTPTAAGTYSFEVSGEDWPEYPNPRQQSCQTAAQYTLTIASADVGVTQTASPDPVKVGEKISFNVRASNAGPTEASGVVITDTLPANVQLVDATWSGEQTSHFGTCSGSGGTVTCDVGNLDAPGGGNSYADAVITVVPKQTGTLTNRATVATSSYDPNSANNESSLDAKVEPGPGADLAVAVTAERTRVDSGSTFTVTYDVENRVRRPPRTRRCTETSSSWGVCAE